MSEQSNRLSEADRQKLHKEYVSVFSEVWSGFSDPEKVEYQRLYREVYAWLPMYYKVADEVSRLHSEEKRLASSVEKIASRWLPINLVILGILLFIDLHQSIEGLSIAATISTFGMLCLKVCEKILVERDRMSLRWRETEITTTLESAGVKASLRYSAWDLHRRQESESHYDQDGMEHLEFHWKIRHALLDAVRPFSTMNIHSSRFAAEAGDTKANAS